MPEGGLQQLFIVVLFVAFGLIDLIGRWAKGRRQGNGGGASPTPSPWPRMEWPDDDDDDAEFTPAEQGRTWRPIDAPPPVEVPVPTKTRASSQQPVSAKSAPARSSAPLRAASLRAAPKPLAPAAPAPTVRRRTPVIDVREARRAIIAATVLGPCLALQREPATNATTRAPALD
jgi:hypothetical protein